MEARSRGPLGREPRKALVTADKPVFGYDYDLDRWSTGEHDSEGHLIWETRLPDNDQWESIRIVTINFLPGEEEGDYRNYHISPDRPLDPYGLGTDEDTDYYDLDDLVHQAFLHYGFEV